MISEYRVIADTEETRTVAHSSFWREKAEQEALEYSLLFPDTTFEVREEYWLYVYEQMWVLVASYRNGVKLPLPHRIA